MLQCGARFQSWRRPLVRRPCAFAVTAARRAKPSIPLVGGHGIPLTDELDLVLALDQPI